jgi:hypothetical protein
MTISTFAAHAAPIRMAVGTRLFVGIANVLVGIASLVALVAAYGLSERLVAAQERAGASALATESWTWWGPDVALSLNMSLLLLGAAGGLVGSAVQQSIVFALRAGHQTLEQGFVWWYVLRPVWSGLLGALSVVVVNAGLVSIGDTTTSTAGVTVLAAAGALAGLFTDQTLTRMSRAAGATPHDTLATTYDAAAESRPTPPGAATA